MNLTIPIYVESLRPAGGAAVFRVRPLFFPRPTLRGDKLDRVLVRLAHDLDEMLTALGREARHDELARWTFYPRLAQQRIDLTLELRRRTARCRFLFVSFREFGRRLAFTPSVPDVWFDLARGESLHDRAAEALTRHFRDLERDDEEVNPEANSLTGAAYVTPLELSIRPPAEPPEAKVSRFLTLGADAPADGATELRRVGRCLDRQYPDDLDRSHLREAEVDELTRLLNADDRRPVLLVGQRLVGKTALVHECVFRRVARREGKPRERRNVWLLAPGRLISGMSYVGQWENRLLAILKHAVRTDQVLYFDDLLGLFQAGRTGQSTLSAADVLKPHLERRRVRVLGEITPEALRVLRERDRGFADLFHLLPVRETDDAETLRVLIAVQRLYEGELCCRFDLDVLPTVIDLQRRYARGVAFPGKGATFLRQLAVKHRGEAVTRADALAEFHARSGLAVTFLDRNARLDRREILEALGKRVIGQDAALHAAADVIGVAKARLNDPDRPLASFLFLGPTGVGKTHCAKAIAAYLFGDADRLLRFDLNEFSAPGSAARLVGTFDRPEGLLTGAVRRQPFAVILLDEVEKANPEVFDVLLQVLGEGRLTDALGRTADFTSALIVMTSNLGVRESEGAAGFRKDDAERDAAFVRAAERFFRPEFFNRLDRVLPFRRLTRGEVRGIARGLLDDVFGREGVVQRKCLPRIDDAALEWVVDQGYDPVLGARALKRAVERCLAQPLAQQLAALPPGSFTVVDAYAAPDGLTVRVRPLEQVEPLEGVLPDLTDPETRLKQVRAVVRRIEDEIAPLRPEGAVDLSRLSEEERRYFTVREQLDGVREEERRLTDRVEEARRSRAPLPVYRREDPGRLSVYSLPNSYRNATIRPLLREMAAALDITEYLRDLAQSAAAPVKDGLSQDLLALLRRAALADLIAACVRAPAADRAVLWVRDGRAERRLKLWHWLGATFGALRVECGRMDDVEASFPDAGLFWLAEGPHAVPLTRLEAGAHLLCPPHAAVELVAVEALPVENGAEPLAVVAARIQRQQAWLTAVGEGRADGAADPDPPGRVVRVYHGSLEDGRADEWRWVDVRTGLTGPARELAGCLLAALPLPPEFDDDTETP